MKWNRDVVCPVCRSTSAGRINRTGLFERKVLGPLGIYPWKCGACGSKFLLRRRGVRHTKRQTPDITAHS